MSTAKLRRALYGTYTLTYTVSDKALADETKAYIIINSIDIDYDSLANSDTDLKTYIVNLELRHNSTTSTDIDILEDFIVNNLLNLKTNLKQNSLETRMLSINSSTDNSDTDAGYYSRILTLSLILKV